MPKVKVVAPDVKVKRINARKATNKTVNRQTAKK